MIKRKETKYKNVEAARKSSVAAIKAKLSAGVENPSMKWKTAGDALKVECKCRTTDGSSTTKELSLDLFTIRNLPSSIRAWIFNLFEQNMKAMYERSQGGYDAKEKRAELFDPESRFLVLRDVLNSSKPLAYSIFRFDTEEKMNESDDEDESVYVEVIYCYEVQVEPPYSGTGLGRILMNALNQIGNDWGMEKVMLTVLKHNVAASKFYERIGFTADEICPSLLGGGDNEMEKVDYLILSKTCRL